MSGFKGFNQDFTKFFIEQKSNNDRNWFNADKQRYQEVLLEPMGEFIRAAARLNHFVRDALDLPFRSTA